MTSEEAAMLSTLVYCPGMHEGICQRGERLENLLNRGFEEPQTGYTKEQWDAFLDKVRNDPDLRRLKVEDVDTNPYDEGAMVVLVDEDTHQAVILFQGTTQTQKAWVQNAESGYRYTDSQAEAVRYTNEWTAKLREKYGDSYVYATGHSKGGNEAALVAVECEGVDAAFAFDAPGNGEAYFDDPKHADNARRNAYKVTYYSNENCFVSALNTRYNTREYWLKSGFDEWIGAGGFQSYLAFSPMSHATSHLFNGENYQFDYADGPAQHVVELNRFSRWIEQNLPKDDCACLLNALGILLGNTLPDGEQLDIGEFLRLIEPRVLAILLVAIEDYPYSAELLDAVFDPGCVDKLLEEYGDDIIAWTANIASAESNVSALFPGATTFLAFLGTVLGSAYVTAVLPCMGAARAKIVAYQAAAQIAEAVQGILNAFHTHDFTEEKLSILQSIVGSFKASPLVLLYNTWQSLFGGSGIFSWISLSFINTTVASVGALLDQAIDVGLNIIGDKFNQAWEADSQQGSALGKAREPLSQATEMIRTIV